MKVSIIIPVYNVQKYIKRCLDSVCNQSFQDIECILVDDCGKDDSVMIVDDYISKYFGSICFKLVHHTHNQGLSGARNTGIRNATGDYLYFLDSDDVITPDCIETLTSLATKYPEAVFVQGNVLDNDGKLCHYSFDKSIPEYCDDQQSLENLMLLEIITSAWNRLIKRSFILEHELFFPVGMIHEDTYWTFFISKYAHAAAFTSKGTYLYFTTEGSIMTSVSKEMGMKRLQSRLQASDAYYHDMKLARHPSKARRIYFAVNLLSSLNELNALRSVTTWLRFWAYVLRLGTINILHTTPHRFLFLFTLLPPVCFFAAKKQYRWRIQKNIISHL